MEKKKRGLGKYVLAFTILCIHIIPFYILIGMAFKSPQELTSRWQLPRGVYLPNIITAIEKGNILQAIKNSSIITGASVFLVVIIGAMSAYPLSRNRTNFNKGMLTFIMGVMMIPPLSVLVPLYSMLANMKMISTYYGIILVLVTFQLPQAIYLYRNFIMSIPIELDEAATIDGCTGMGIFRYIIMPLLKPVTVSVVILSGVAFWNDFQFSLYILQSPKLKTITLSISAFFSQFSNNLNAASAGALIGILPVVAVFLLLQKYFVQGMIDSALK